MGAFLIISAAASSALAVLSAGSQPGSAIAIDQVPTRSAPASGSSSVRVAPVRGASSSASAQESTNVPTIAPEVIAACRAAQVEDRPAPEGIDCVAALQASAQAAEPETAERYLLNLFGFGSNLTGETTTQSIDGTSADAAARQLATGNIQDSGAAAAIARQQAAAPPPSAGPR